MTFKTFKKYAVTSVVLCLIMIGCSTKDKAQAPKLEAVNYDQLFSLVQQNDDKLYVVNFWATWCRPCMEELPHFLEVDDEYRKGDDYQMILVSLDKSTNLNTTVAGVVKRMNIKPDVLLLDDAKRMNDFINLINVEWSGSIPATVLYKNGKQLAFHEGQLSKEELDDLIKTHK